jgi:hypothetical protein
MASRNISNIFRVAGGIACLHKAIILKELQFKYLYSSVFIINKMIAGTFRSYLCMHTRYIRLVEPGSSPLDFRETKYFTRGTEILVYIIAFSFSFSLVYIRGGWCPGQNSSPFMNFPIVSYKLLLFSALS